MSVGEDGQHSRPAQTANGEHIAEFPDGCDVSERIYVTTDASNLKPIIVNVTKNTVSMNIPRVSPCLSHMSSKHDAEHGSEVPSPAR